MPYRIHVKKSNALDCILGRDYIRAHLTFVRVGCSKLIAIKDITSTGGYLLPQYQNYGSGQTYSGLYDDQPYVVRQIASCSVIHLRGIRTNKSINLVLSEKYTEPWVYFCHFMFSCIFVTTAQWGSGSQPSACLSSAAKSQFAQFRF